MKPNESIVTEILFWNASGTRTSPHRWLSQIKSRSTFKSQNKAQKNPTFFLNSERRDRVEHIPIKFMSAQSNICKIKQALKKKDLFASEIAALN